MIKNKFFLHFPLIFGWKIFSSLQLKFSLQLSSLFFSFDFSQTKQWKENYFSIFFLSFQFFKIQTHPNIFNFPFVVKRHGSHINFRKQLIWAFCHCISSSYCILIGSDHFEPWKEVKDAHSSPK